MQQQSHSLHTPVSAGPKMQAQLAQVVTDVAHLAGVGAGAGTGWPTAPAAPTGSLQL